MPPADEFFACANGLLHLPTGELYTPTADYFCVTASPALFDPDAPEPTQWLAFLDQLFEDDTEAIEALQDWFGYLLSSDTSQQKIFAMVGPKRCGKGTVGRLLTKLLGAKSVAGPPMNSLGETFGLEPLITKSLATISDVRIGSRTDKSTIVERLLSISGEDHMTVPRKYAKAWSGSLLTRIMIMSNELPALPDGSGALAGRFIILVLTETFYGREDTELTNKLSSELSGILNWAIAGYRRLHERKKFVQPASGTEAIESIEALGSPVKAFVRDRCSIGPDQKATLNDLFTAWTGWCEKNGGKGGTKEWFARNLRAVVPGLKTERPTARPTEEQAERPETEQPRSEDERIRTYKGIGLPF